MNNLLLVFLVGISGCALVQEKPPVDKVIYVTSPLYAPKDSELPTLNAKDLQCLTPDVKRKLLTRDRLLHNDREALKTIIKSTQK